jgi:hypothetical protein
MDLFYFLYVKLSNRSFGCFQGISVPFKWAVCVPSSCAATDIKNFLTTAFNLPVNVDPLGCHTKEARPFTPLDWIAM